MTKKAQISIAESADDIFFQGNNDILSFRKLPGENTP